MNKTLMASRLLARTGLGAMLRRTARRRGFVVLNYHRVGDPAVSRLDHGVFSATAPMFERQIGFLKRECDLIVPSDIEYLRRRQWRGNYAMITFDDGYRDNYEVAYPILRSLKVPAVFFLTTGFIDRPKVAWWDEIAWIVRTTHAPSIGPLHGLPTRIVLDSPDREQQVDTILSAFKALPSSQTHVFLDNLATAAGTGHCPPSEWEHLWMTWDMIRQMRAGGMVIGGHTVNHPILSRMPKCEQHSEIAGCAQRLESQLGEPMRYFSYPRGKLDSFGADTQSCLRETQVQFAFSFYGGMNHETITSNYDIRRVSVDSSMSMDLFAAILSLPQLFA